MTRRVGGWVAIALIASLLSVAVPPAGAQPPGVPAAGGTLWVTNEAGYVSVYDAATGDVIATIPVGAKLIGIAALPEFAKVYVPNENSNTVSVISTATMSVVATIPVGPKPHDVWASPDEHFVYVSNFGTVASPSNTVSVIDTATDTVAATFTAGPSNARTHAVWVPKNGQTLYALNRVVNTLVAMDPITGSIRWTLAAGSGSHLVTSANSKIGYLTNSTANKVEIVDLEAPSVISSVSVGAGPDSVWISPNGRWLVTGDAGVTKTVSIVDLSSGNVQSVSFTGTPRHVTVSANSKFAYVALAGGAPGVAVIDLANGVVASIFVATGTPHGILYMPVRMG